jgi:hypothetical protein
MELTFGEMGNNVAASEDIKWVNETKSIICNQGQKLHTIEFLGMLSSGCCLHKLEPTDPQELKSAGLIINHLRSDMYSINMVYSKDSGIFEWMG